MNQINKETIIFESHTPRLTEFDTTKGMEAVRNSDGSVSVRISSETEYSDRKHQLYTISASEAETFGRALLCMEDGGFDAMIGRALEWGE